MALYTRSQFAQLCGKNKAAVSMGLKRGQLILSGDYIDDSIYPNSATKEKWMNALGGSVSVQPKKVVSSKKKTTGNLKKVEDPKPRILPAPNVQEPEYSSESVSDLDRKKKQAEIKYKESQTRLAELKESKLRGENIPTDMVMNVVSILGHSLQASYKNGAMLLLMEMSHKMKFSPEYEAEMKGRLIDLINSSHSNGISEAKKGIKTIVSEMSATDNLTDEDE